MLSCCSLLQFAYIFYCADQSRSAGNYFKPLNWYVEARSGCGCPCCEYQGSPCWLQVTYVSQAALQLTLAVLWGTGRGVVTRTTLAGAVLALVSTVCLLVLSFFEHGRSIRPSAILQLFYFMTILVDLPRIRTQWLLDGNTIAAALVTVIFVLRLPLLWLESVQKWHHSNIPAEKIPPEERQGIFGRTFFWWLNPLFLEGYHRDLTMDDLFAIDDGLKGTILYNRLLKSWNGGKYPGEKKTRSGSVLTCL